MSGLVAEYVESQRKQARSRGRRFRVRRPPREVPAIGLERAYTAFLAGVTGAVAAELRERLFPLLDGLVRESGGRSDAAGFDLSDIESVLSTISEEVRARVDNKHLRDLQRKVEEYQKATSEHSMKQLRRQIRSMISLDAFPPAGTAESNLLSSWVEANRKRIKALTDLEIEEVEDVVRRGVQAGDRAVLIRERVEDRFPVVEARANLIARDQVNKLRGNLARVRQTSLGVDKYIWRTSRDERVRESHLVKEGQVFAWNEPPPDTGHPGQDIQCRCTAEPYIEGEPPPPEDREAIIAQVREKRQRLWEKKRRRR